MNTLLGRVTDAPYRAAGVVGDQEAAFQSAAFATGLLPDIYAFHRYTGNSALLSRPLAE